MKGKFITKKRKHADAIITAIMLAVSIGATVFEAGIPRVILAVPYIRYVYKFS